MLPDIGLKNILEDLDGLGGKIPGGAKFKGSKAVNWASEADQFPAMEIFPTEGLLTIPPVL